MATFEERTGGREPHGRFGVDVAEWNRTYVLHAPLPGGGAQAVTSQETYDRINLIIGGTLPGPSPRPLGSPGGAGSVDRRMPMCDPQFAGLFADAPMVRVNGQELYRQDQYGLGPLLAVPPIVPGFALYHAVEFDIPFSARPYAVLPNERMVAGTMDFYDTDGSRKRLTYYPEYLRYVQTFVDDQDSRISASVGAAMAFRVPSATPLNALKGLDGSMYSGVPDMIVPDQKIVLRWYQVPLRYITSANSYLVRYKGFINQVAYVNRVKGSLLYMAPKVIKTYTPPQFLPTQQPPTIDGFSGILDGSFYAEPLVDLELNFIFTMRRRYAPEAAPGDFTADPDAIPNVERPNNSWVDGPHQWMPHFPSKRYFYAHASTPRVAAVGPPLPGESPQDEDYARWMPSYNSVPAQLLFQDPDVTGIVVNL